MNSEIRKKKCCFPEKKARRQSKCGREHRTTTRTGPRNIPYHRISYSIYKLGKILRRGPIAVWKQAAAQLCVLEWD
ncbi:hypothetical protein RLOC_00005294, partial [Lonchura striata]